MTSPTHQAGLSLKARPAAVGSIPMSWDDSRFASNTPGSITSGQVTNKDWDDFPSYADGEPCFYADNNGSVFTKCRIDWREGPRLDSTSACTVTFDQCYVSCWGVDTDHADAFQAYAGSGTIVDFHLTNSFVRAYMPNEANDRGNAGSGAGSTNFFWADHSIGTITWTNVIMMGGEIGARILCDKGPVHLNFDHVYIVTTPAGGGGLDIGNFGGSFIIIDNWTNVFNATISNGNLVVGSPIPPPV